MADYVINGKEMTKKQYQVLIGRLSRDFAILCMVRLGLSDEQILKGLNSEELSNNKIIMNKISSIRENYNK